MNPKRFALMFVAFITLCAGVFAQYRTPFFSPKVQFFDRNGKPLAYGKVYSYVAGTTTPKATYSSSTGAALTNPVILDSAGRAEIWLDSTTSYKFILKDKNDVQQWSVDNITDWGGNYASGTTTLTGDTTGALTSNTVSKLQGISISATAPTDGQVLKYTSSAWTPGSVYDFITFAGPSSTIKTFTLPNASDTVATYAVKNVFTKAQVVTPSNLAISAVDGSVAVDASLSNHFRLTLTTDCPCTVATPSNPTDGQEVLFEITQATGGNETLDWSAAFAWSSGVAKPTITVTASKKDFVRAVYNLAATKWFVMSVTQGY